MANELVVNCSLEYEDTAGVLSAFSVENLRRSITTKKPLRFVQEIGITEEAVILGESATFGYFMARNMDPTNFVEIRVGTGGADFTKLLPDDVCLLPLGADAQAPYAIANTAPCLIEIMIVPR